MALMLKSKKQMKEELDGELGFFLEGKNRLNTCKEDLMDLLSLHREMWTAGVRPPGLGPGAMFRTDNISTMSPDEVYLGNVDGIWTNNITFFEGIKDSDRETYGRVCRQYSGHIRRSLDNGCRMVYNDGFSEARVVDEVSCYMRTMNNAMHSSVCPDVKLLSPAFGRNSIIHCLLLASTDAGPVKVESSFLLDGRRPWFPVGFMDGVVLTKGNYADIRFSTSSSLKLVRGSEIVSAPDKVRDMGRGEIGRRTLVDRYRKHRSRML